MKLYQERVCAEREELARKLERLDEFLMGEHDDLPPDELDRMTRQRLIMTLYVQVLNERVKAFGA